MPQENLKRGRKAEERWIKDVRRKDLMPPTFHSPVLDPVVQKGHPQPKTPISHVPVRRERNSPVQREKVSYAAEDTLAEPSILQKNFPASEE